MRNSLSPEITYIFESTDFGNSVTTGGTYPVMDSNRWKYNGEEVQTTGNVNWLDYGAREYDEVTGRWTRPDPMSEKYYGTSGYTYCVDNPINLVDLNGTDAKVTVMDSTISIHVQIYIYGNGASKEEANKIQKSIMNEWNRGFVYIDEKTREKYKVIFDVNVKMYDTNNPNNSPGYLSDRYNPFSTNNYVEIGATGNDVKRSFVIGGDEGKWRGYGLDPSVHEFGHLIGLRDHYSDESGIENGWSGNVMSEPAGYGLVEQKNINAVAMPIVDRYKRSKQYRSHDKHKTYITTIDERNPNW